MTSPILNITIPTYNRAHCIERAVDAALAQSYRSSFVTVIDDGSRDETPRLLRSYESEPRFGWIRLGRNVGTAQAKNVAILLARYDAITFHDSDDIPSEHKLLLQGRALELGGLHADTILDWRAIGHEPETRLEVDVVVGAYTLIKMDGTVFRIDKRVSLVDDFFPNLQFPSKTEGDWCLINAGLFRRRVFEQLGGYLDSIEEDRELRNRTIAAGAIYYFVTEPLLTKVESPDSLTVAVTTGYRADRRLADRDEVWRRNRLYRSGVLGERVAREAKVVMNLSDVVIEECRHRGAFGPAPRIPCTEETREAVERWFAPEIQAGAAE